MVPPPPAAHLLLASRIRRAACAACVLLWAWQRGVEKRKREAIREVYVHAFNKMRRNYDFRLLKEILNGHALYPFL